MGIENAVSVEIPSTCHKKKKRKRQDEGKNVEAIHDCPEGTSSVRAVPTNADATTLEPPTNVISEKKTKKKKGKTSDDCKINSTDHKSTLLENNSSVNAAPLDPSVNAWTIAVPTKAEDTTLEPLANVASEKKKKRKKSKTCHAVIDNESGSLDSSASVKDATPEPSLDICTVTVTTKAEATTVEPPASLTSEKKKKGKIADGFKMNGMDHESASMENTASVKDTPWEPPVNIDMVAVSTTVEDLTNVNSEKKKKKKKSKIADEFKMNAIDKESSLMENNASVKDTPREPPVNIDTVPVSTVVEATTLDPANVTSEKKKKKTSKRSDDFKMNLTDHESASLENSASVKDTPLEPPVNILTIADPRKVVEATTLEPSTNGTSEKKKKNKKNKASSDTQMNVVDHESASLENGASAKDTSLEPSVNICTIAVPTKVEEATTLDPPTDVTLEKKKKDKASSDSKMDVVDHESSSLENGDSAKDTSLEPSVNICTIAVPTKAEEATTLDPPTDVTLERKKKKKKDKASSDSKMDVVDHESASLENGASAKDTSLEPPVNICMIAVPTKAEVATTSDPLTDVTFGKKKRKKKDKASSNSKMDVVDHESAFLENNASAKDTPVIPLANSSMIADPREAEAMTLEPPTNVASEKKKKKKKSKTNDDSKMNTTDHLSASLEASASKVRLHPESVVGTDTVINSERCPLEFVLGKESVASSEKKRRKRSRSKDPTTDNIDSENLNGAILEPTAVRREQQSLEISDQSSTAKTTNLEKPTPNSDLGCSEQQTDERNRKKRTGKQKNKQAMEPNVHENNDKVLDGTVQPPFKSSVEIEPEVKPQCSQSSLSHVMVEEEQKKFSASEIDDMDHALNKIVGILSQGDFVTEVAGLNSTGIKEEFLNREEQSGLSNGVNNGSIKKCNGHTEVCNVLETREFETYKRRKKNHHMKVRKSSDSGDKLQPVGDKDGNDTSSLCSVEENTSVTLNDKFEKTSSGIDVSEKVADIMIQKDTVNHSIKIEKTREEAPLSSNNGEVEDVVHLDAVVTEGNIPQMPNTLPERSLVVCSKKKLLILDVNGILVEFVSQVPRINVDKVVNFLFNQTRHKLLFCWDQSHCTPTGLNTIENKSKPLVLKELRKVWEKVEPDLPFEKGEYDETNTLLLDDSPYKALRNPANIAVFPFPYKFNNRQDNSLGPGGDLRTYLEGLSEADNVKEYVEQNPFGQGAITKSHKQWSFYCQIVGAGEPVSKL
ncbi:hypothetical protein L484_019068 [Morus notabilis]|uniref:FCP1 homology domain-containing protein n=1 Tax=Morus notabilis TaxID=981085 RepID=W9RR30_9ROSA|nr:hypothetical protein L484_019068 [Morus notabilis]